MKFMSKLWEKLRKLFTITPEQLKYAEQELKFLFGIEEKPIRKKENKNKGKNLNETRGI